MVGPTLLDIRDHIERLAVADGQYYLRCGRTGDRPVPVARHRFPNRATARAAARATEQYRSTLRRYDPQVPYYDLIVCEVSPPGTVGRKDGKNCEPRKPSATLSDPVVTDTAPTGRRDLVEFCHRVAGAVFETLSETGYESVESAVMDVYFEVAETVSDPDELCLCLLDSIAVELDDRLSPVEQAEVLADAAARMETDTPLGETHEDGDADTEDNSPGSADEDDEQEEPAPAGRNEWLVVDELNRADADQAFGSLFTVLSDETVTLSFDTPGGNPVTVVGDPDDYDGPHVNHNGDQVPEARRSHYFVPESWRLVATANSADKATLYRLSYALMRRFEFVHVPAPGPETLIDGDEPDSSVVEPYFDYWSDDWRVGFEDATEAILSHAGDSPAAEALQSAIDNETVEDPFEELGADTVQELVADADAGEHNREQKVLRSILHTVVAEHLARIWAAASSGSRDIGPGIVSDLAEHVLVRLAGTGQLTYDQAVAGTLLPQFENRRQELEGFLEELGGVPGFEEIDDENPDAATAVLAADYLNVDVTPDAGGTDS